MLRRTIALWTILFMVGAWAGTVPPKVNAAPSPSSAPNWQVARSPSLSAGAAILMDWQTGEILYERNARNRKDPASTTKVLTAVIALERGRLSDQVKVSRRAAHTIGSSMYIKEGQVYSLRDLLYGLLLRSGNDAAVAIAEHIAGSVEQFAAMMNTRARELGATGTHFTNPHGLTDANHYSSAHDLAVIARQALKNDQFAEIVATRSTQITYEQQERVVDLYNTNRLLSIMPEADGVKTGTTAAAGACLIASATRDNHKLVAVVLQAGNRWNDAARVLNWGFDQFRLARFGQRDEVITKAVVLRGKVETVPLALTHELVTVVPRRAEPAPTVQIRTQSLIDAPVRKGQVLGKAVVLRNGQTVAQADLVAAQDVPRRTLFDWLYRAVNPLLRWMFDGDML